MTSDDRSAPGIAGNVTEPCGKIVLRRRVEIVAEPCGKIVLRRRVEIVAEPLRAPSR
jgi:hypothetical protein